MSNHTDCPLSNELPIVHMEWMHHGEAKAGFGRIMHEDEQFLVFYLDDEKTVVTIPKTSILQRTGNTDKQSPIDTQPLKDDISEEEVLEIIQSLSFESTGQNNHPIPLFTEGNDETLPLSGDGFISIQNHQISIQDPLEGKEPAVLLPHPELEIRVNDKKIQRPTKVFAKDKITWNYQHHSAPFELKASQSKLQLSLLLDRSATHYAQLMDKPPQKKMLLEHTWVPCSDDSLLAKIVDRAHQMGVQVPLDQDLITAELSHPTYEPMVIAQGVAVTPSCDGYLEFLVSDRVEEVLEEVNGRVDYRERFRIPNVKTGDVIAIVHPPVEGKPGLNIFGEKLLPKPPRKVEVKLGRYVDLTQEGKIVATKEGRPSISGRSPKTIEVSRTFTIKENVDMRTGNVYFSGDLEIYGDVCEGMRVEAIGQVHIHGNVYSASVFSTQGVMVAGNVVNSKIAAGQYGLFWSQLYQIVQELYDDLDKLAQAALQTQYVLQSKGTQTPVGRIINLLVESKFPTIPHNVKRLHEILGEMSKKYPLGVEYTLLQRMLRLFTHPHSIVTQTIDSISSIRFALQKELNRAGNSIQEESDIYIDFSSHSSIQTNGSIIFTGKGALTSEIEVGKDCVFRKPRAVLKGGKINAEHKIIAQEVGSEYGSIPFLQAGKLIQAERLVAAKIKIGQAMLEVDRPMDRAKFSFSDGMNSIVTSTY